jgi:hypothetical protein
MSWFFEARGAERAEINMQLKKPCLIYTLLILILSSCTTEVTQNPSSATDFVLGQAYELKRPAWMKNGALLTLRDKAPPDSEGVLSQGTKLLVRKVERMRGPEHGTTTEVYAEVISGSFKGKIVDISVISERLKTGFTRRDPEMLTLIEGNR